MLSEEAKRYTIHEGPNEGRVVLHSDLNNFFASVECLKHRELAAYPVAVCGSAEERHGIVLAKNTLAKSFGIKTGQVIWQAKQLCPSLVVLEPHYEEYVRYSNAVRRIYSAYSDRVEPFGMDEAWLELTGNVGIRTLYDGVNVAYRLRKEIYEATGLTVSIGVSDNKTFAKLASDYRKPDAVTLFGPEQYLEKIAGLAIGEMMFVGRSAQKRLKNFSIETIGDAAKGNEALFRSLLGKNGVGLYRGACGYDTSPVQPSEAEEIIKSIGNSATPSRDIRNEEELRIMLFALSDKVSARLRKAGLLATVLQIHTRTQDLKIAERQCVIRPTDHAGDLAEQAFTLYKRHFPPELVLRSLGIRTSGFLHRDESYQSSLFDSDSMQTERLTALDNTVDSLRARYGRNIIRRGVLCTDRALYAPLHSEKHLAQPFHSH